jgi:DNA-binding MarR family transcriptional regulator
MVSDRVPEIDVVLRVQALARSMSARVMAELDVDDVRESDGYVFQHLVPGPQPVSVLADRLAVSQQAASKAVADLERRGLVERQVDPDDARVRLVALSERGWQAVEGARAARQAIVAELAAVLGPQRWKRFERDLAEVLGHVGGLDVLLTRRLRAPD